MCAIVVKAGPILTTATIAGVGVEVEVRGVTVTTAAEVTTGGPGGSPSQGSGGTVGAYCEVLT